MHQYLFLGIYLYRSFYHRVRHVHHDLGNVCFLRAEYKLFLELKFLQVYLLILFLPFERFLSLFLALVLSVFKSSAEGFGVTTRSPGFIPASRAFFVSFRRLTLLPVDGFSFFCSTFFFEFLTHLYHQRRFSFGLFFPSFFLFSCELIFLPVRPLLSFCLSDLSVTSSFSTYCFFFWFFGYFFLSSLFLPLSSSLGSCEVSFTVLFIS